MISFMMENIWTPVSAGDVKKRTRCRLHTF